MTPRQEVQVQAQAQVGVGAGVESDMEPATRYRKGRKKKAWRDREIEARLLEHDKEVQKVTGDGLSAWDRFLDLMTPAFCSCAPAHTTHQHQHQARKVVE